MTTEEKAKEFAKNLGCEEGLWLWKMMANFHNSQPPNLICGRQSLSQVE
jgi:hypothetical protein